MNRTDRNGIKFEELKERVAVIKHTLKVKEMESKQNRFNSNYNPRQYMSLSPYERDPMELKKAKMLQFNTDKYRNVIKDQSIFDRAVKQVSMNGIKCKSRHYRNFVLSKNESDLFKKTIDKTKQKVFNSTSRTRGSFCSSFMQDTSIPSISEIKEYEHYDKNYIPYRRNAYERNRNNKSTSLINKDSTERSDHMSMISIFPQHQNKSSSASPAKKLNMSSSCLLNIRKGGESAYHLKKSRKKFLKPESRVVPVINKPIYKYDIYYFYQRYEQLKKILCQEKEKFEEKGILPQEKIDLIMKQRAEMELHKLKNKFALAKFKPPKSSLTQREQRERFLSNLLKKMDLIDVQLL